MNPDRILKADDIKITGIKVIKGSIEFDENDIRDKDVTFKSHVQYSIGTNIELNVVKIIFSITLFPIEIDRDVDLSTIKTKASYTVEYFFEVRELSDFVERYDAEKARNQVSSLLGQTLMTIVYSTTRGIVHTRTQGTIFDGVIMQVVDPIILLSPEFVTVPSAVEQ